MQPLSVTRRGGLLFLFATLLVNTHLAAETLTIAVRDESDRPLPSRVHLLGPDGKPVRAPGLPFWFDHLVTPGDATLDVAPGAYSWTIERGPEHESLRGDVTVEKNVGGKIERRLARIANLREKGWWSADLHVHRPLEDVELLMRAEDLDFAPVITWWNQRNPWKDTLLPDEPVRRVDGHRFVEALAGEDEREGGALLYFGLDRPLEITQAAREYPSPMRFVAEAHAASPDVWIDIEKPFWWDVPTWLASGQMDSIGLANNHMCRDRMYENEAWGRARDSKRLPAPLGNGFWTQEIYYHALEAGLRIPPSAGSASGVLPNPVGYNRVYAQIRGEFTRESWFRALRAGRVFVTNGPLLRVRANGRHPGAVFAIDEGQPREVELRIDLISRDAVRRVEVIHNGKIVQSLVPKSEREQTLRATLSLDASGWFLVRALGANETTFRFASTGPFWIEEGPAATPGARRVSRSACAFFAQWLEERIERMSRNLAKEPEQLAEALAPHLEARAFWKKRLAAANAP